MAAFKLGCTRQTVENYVKRYPTVAQAVKEERQKTVDVAEGKLFDKLKTGESWAIQFILKTLGKDRGYTERQEMDVTTKGQPIKSETTIVVREHLNGEGS